MSSTLQIANASLMPNYGHLGLEITSGQGAWVWTRDPSGRRKKCLDLLCGLGVNSLGHCHPKVVKAIEKQARQLMHVSNLYATRPMAMLAQQLVGLSGDPKSKVFFGNSGTEANEAAAKLARIWAHENFGPKKKKIIALKQGFHGRTWMSITMTGQPKMQEKFAPNVPGVRFVELNNTQELRKVVDENVCAVIFEVIQAEGGIHRMNLEYYDELYNLSVEYDFLRIVDEVQTGIGRTGFVLAHDYFREEAGHQPEIITLAKALGGGLPIGAVIARNGLGKFMLPGSHAATFGGNPVACAAGLAVLKAIEKQKLLGRVRYLGDYMNVFLLALAKKYPQKIKEVRGRGLIQGVELHEGHSAGEVVKQMYEKGVLIGTAGPQVVRFLPPFIVTEDELNKALKKFAQVIKSL
jgi:acetylornithine/N-succinyldiaminopimelate aminotransferase